MSGEIIKACEKELSYVKSREEALYYQSQKKISPLREKLTSLIPPGVNEKLCAAFVKAFSLIFSKGVNIIEKSFNKEELLNNQKIKDYAFSLKASRTELIKMRAGSITSLLAGSAVTTAEGVGLGALGIGLPDIVLFLGIILKGVYETALKYGYDYDDPAEKLLILTMLEASVSRNEEWIKADAAVNELLLSCAYPDDDMIRVQTQSTANAFALDMLAVKFIQGMPLIGMAGGIYNPVYYNKIMKYVQLKYHKRYLLSKINAGDAQDISE